MKQATLRTSTTRVTATHVCMALFCAVLFLQTGCSKTPAEAASKKNLRFGTAISISDILDQNSAEFVKTNFNTIVADNAMKWEHLHPKPTFWNWTDPDKMADYAVANGMKMRGHTFVWHSQNPGYVNNFKTRDQAVEAMKEQITTTMERYKGKIYEYDIANEIFNEDGTMRESRWLTLVGSDYIDIAFTTARAADPDASLILNDYNNEAAGYPKADGMYNFVKSMVDRGIPIDGVGFQLHLSTENPYPPEAIRENVRRYAELGLKVCFTEIDVRIPQPNTPEAEEKQAFIYKDLLNIALSEPNVDTYIVWGYTDKTSWIPRAFPGNGSAHLLDKDKNPKPVFNDIIKMLQ